MTKQLQWQIVQTQKDFENLLFSVFNMKMMILNKINLAGGKRVFKHLDTENEQHVVLDTLS